MAVEDKLEGAFGEMQEEAKKQKQKLKSFIGIDGRIINLALLVVALFFLSLVAYSFAYYCLFADMSWLAHGFLCSATPLIGHKFINGL
jgi:hypothetical protein